jgi:anti-sigma regulatory factor (Ser/Thr protein kinase)
VTDDGPGLTDAAIPAALPAPDFGEDGRGLWLAQELSDRLSIAGGAGGATVTLEFDLAVTRRDTPGLAPAAAPGEPARR